MDSFYRNFRLDLNNFYNIMYRYMYSFDIDHSIIDKKKIDWYIWKWINIIKLNMLNMRLFSDFNKKKMANFIWLNYTCA